jgi:Putative DNA-binding domain
MPLSKEQRELFSRVRSETLSTEIKSTIDLSTDEGKAKIVKVCQALYNRNGGHLLVGFDNQGQPQPLPSDLLLQFTSDAIQEIISRHSSPAFEVDLDFLDISGDKFPVLTVPSGVRIPTSVRKELRSKSDGTTHLKYEDILVRTINQNGRVSTATMRPADLPDLLDTCFSNRETDIASFVRKHLADLQSGNFAGISAPANTTAKLAHMMDDLESITDTELKDLKDPKPEPWLLSALTIKAVVFCDPPIDSDGVPTESFLSSVYSANPNLTGWPVWMDTSQFSDSRARPHVRPGGWNTIIGFRAFGDEGLEIHRFEPSGRLFFRRVLQDDTSEKIPRGTLLDPVLMVLRVAEIIIVGLSILKSIGASHNGTAHFRFDWTGLNNRKLSSWANPERYFSSRTSQHDSASASISMPISSDQNQVPAFVKLATKALFATFQGFEISDSVIGDLVTKLVTRRL